MITLILLNVFFVIFAYNFYVYLFSRPTNFPPGPPKIPFFGSYIFMLLLNRNHLHRSINRICQFYKSTVIGLYLGNDLALILNDAESVKKALNHNDFDGRPNILLGRLRHPNMELHGFFFTEGDLWQEQRRFTLQTLRQFGFGCRSKSLEKEIETQITQFVEIAKHGPKYPHEMKYFKSGQIFLPRAFNSTFSNCFLTVLFNGSIPRDEMSDLYTAVENAFVFAQRTDNYGKLYSMIPSVAKWFPYWSDYKPTRDASIDLYNFFKNKINEQIESFDEHHERHFIDMYVNKMRQAETSFEQKSYYSYEQLIFICIDLMFPASTGLPSTMTFLLQQLCHEPEIQRKIQSEIDEVIGRSRPPTLDDRVNLPYTEACLREIMRYETLVPSGLPHQASVDTEFMGYSIPKGTVIMPSLQATMHDTSVWDKPHEFRPERFLDESGKFCVSRDSTLPFGAGKRQCAGKTFARNMLFLFSTIFLQMFSVRMPDGVKAHSFSDNLTGTIRTTPNHWLKITSRCE